MHTNCPVSTLVFSNLWAAGVMASLQQVWIFVEVSEVMNFGVFFSKSFGHR